VLAYDDTRPKRVGIGRDPYEAAWWLMDGEQPTEGVR
jgi:hypothetical protein